MGYPMIVASSIAAPVSPHDPSHCTVLVASDAVVAPPTTIAIVRYPRTPKGRPLARGVAITASLRQ